MKVTIEITDNPDGTVSVRVTPDLRALAEARVRDHTPPSPAEGYAIHAALAMRDLSRRETTEPEKRLILPPGLVS